MTNFAADYVSRALGDREQIQALDRAFAEDDGAEVAQILTQVLQCGAIIARYIASSAARRGEASATRELNIELREIWHGDRPLMDSNKSIFAFVLPALITIRVFTSRGSSKLSLQRQRSVGNLLEILDDGKSNLQTHVFALSEGIIEKTGYNSEIEAKRAINPWLAIDALTEIIADRNVEMVRYTASTKRRGISETIIGAYEDVKATSSAMGNQIEQSLYKVSCQNDMEAGSGAAILPKGTDADVAGDRSQKVWFATDRSPGPNMTYLNERDPLNRVRYGYCRVEVPQSHKFGSVGSGGIKTLLWWNADKKLKITQTVLLDQKRDFFTRLSADLGTSGENPKALLVYVHGYNVSFAKAIIRAGQLGFDLNRSGVTALYSWPSANKYFMYNPDMGRVDTSVSNFAKFVTDLVVRTKATKINLLVHSMGNKLLIGALPLITKALGKKAKRLENVIMAAPDVDSMLWEQGMTKTKKVTKRATMYISNRDKALDLSYCLSASPRAGYRDPVTVVDGIDTVDVSFTDLSFLGHGYYAESHPVLHDIHTLMHTDLGPAARIRMTKQAHLNGAYWSIEP